MAVQYCGSTKWTAVTAWAALTSYVIGDLRRQLATPTVGQERVFRCTTAGISGASEPSPWTLTKGSTTSDGTAVWTEVTGNSTYGWTAAHAREANMLAWMAAGDDGYLSNNHAETQSTNLNLVSPGTAASFCRILCVSDAASPPTALATTATVTCTGTTNLVFGSGFAYRYGVTYSGGSGSGNSGTLVIGPQATGSWWYRFEACLIKTPATGVNSRITIGQGFQNGQPCRDSLCEFINTQISLAAAGQSLLVAAPFVWKNTASAIQGTVPTTLFLPITAGNAFAPIVLEGVDLSALSSGKNIIDVSGADTVRLYMRDCKLGASVSLTTGSVIGQGGASIEAINCDSADTIYRFYRQNYQATESQETTIVRSGGASDGTTVISRKVVTTANGKIVSPYESLSIEFFNTNTGAQTITIPVITDNVTLQNSDAWLEVEYLGTASFPLGNYASGRVTDPIFGTPANWATDTTSTWATTGLGTPVQQSLSVTLTARVGLIRVRVMVAKASTTLYYDPKVIASSGRQYMSEAGHVNEGSTPIGFITGARSIGTY